MDWAQQMIDFASKQATRIARNYASELCICEVASANDDGSNASIKWNGLVIGSDLVVQTPFTIENVIDVPVYGIDSHYHNIMPSLVSRVGVTTSGESVYFIPDEIDLTPALLPDGTYDMEIVQELTKDLQEHFDITRLSLYHDHGGRTSLELPQIRLWRGVKAGDSVLVLKVNPSCFVILCRLALSNDEGAQGVKTYRDTGGH